LIEIDSLLPLDSKIIIGLIYEGSFKMEVPRHWRLKQQRYALIGEVCPHCDAKVFPPREICPACGADARAQHLSREQVGAIAFPVMDEARRV
jgi:rRNA maturation protein Nop10